MGVSARGVFVEMPDRRVPGPVEEVELPGRVEAGGSENLVKERVR